jgi:hypothetical protein
MKRREDDASYQEPKFLESTFEAHTFRQWLHEIRFVCFPCSPDAF